MGGNKENNTADLSSSLNEFDFFPKPVNHHNVKTSSFSYIKRIRKSRVTNANFINVQSLDEQNEVSLSGGLRRHKQVNISDLEQSQEYFHRELEKRSNRHEEDNNNINIQEIQNEILMSPSRLSEDTYTHSFDVHADIHDLNRKALSSSHSTISTFQNKKSGFLSNKPSLGRILKPLRFNNKKTSDPLPTPVHKTKLALRRGRSVSSHRVTDNSRNLGDTEEISSILNVSHDLVVESFQAVPLEVEDLRKLPKLSRTPSLPPPEIPLRPRLSFLATKEEKFYQKGKLKAESTPLEVIDPSGQLATDDLECWMSKLPHALLEAPLNQLLIPGSHDSFSYSLEWGDIAPDAPDLVGRIAKLAPCLAKPAIMNWSVTQNSETNVQLRHGIRYFDIRVAVKNSRFHFVHGLYGADLEPILEQIRDFLANRKGEVVLLDFQHLHGLMEEDHKLLIDLITTTFEGLICPQQYNLGAVSLQFLSKHNYQVLVFYRHPEGMYEDQLWPTNFLPNPWPRTSNISTMFKFLTAKISMRPRDAFFVTQCILSPSYGYLVKNITGTLEKKMAKPCNKAVVEWLKGIAVGPAGPNIVMTDFVDQDNWAVTRSTIMRNHASLEMP